MITKNIKKQMHLFLPGLLVFLMVGMSTAQEKPIQPIPDPKGNTDETDNLGANMLYDFQDKMLDFMQSFLANRPKKGSVYPGTSAAGSPPLNMFTTDRGVDIQVELPGYDINNIKIEAKNNQLIIKGEKKDMEVDKEKNYYIRESVGGNFIRTVTIPFDFDISKAKASFKNGMLNIFIEKPKEPTVEPKTIPIVPQ